MAVNAALTGTLMLTSPNALPLSAALPQVSEQSPISNLDQSLKSVLPSAVEPLTENQEQQISQILHDTFGIHASAVLEGNRLTRSYGFMGAEQHLARYPGDSVANMAPGRGAWGYFASSKDELTPDLVAKERYYVAVQTLYLPDWTARLAYLRDWYKYRKVVVVNPSSGKIIIAVIADSGPAWWTGKHYGGSPEVMDYLSLNTGMQKGAVILFFLDDPQDQIPLDPLEYNLEIPKLLSS